MVKVCIICGKEFEALNKNKMLCSQDCANKRKSELRHLNKKPLFSEERICACCGTGYTARRPHQKYCSQDCYRIMHNKEKCENSRAKSRARKEEYKSIRKEMNQKNTKKKSGMTLDEKLKLYGCEGYMQKRNAETIEMFCRVKI